MISSHNKKNRKYQKSFFKYNENQNFQQKNSFIIETAFVKLYDLAFAS